MTHLAPLACAIVKRWGGMLIHGAIIARELGIPCVNGIPHAVELLGVGEIVTADGCLGSVTVGVPEFELEAGRHHCGVRGWRPARIEKGVVLPRSRTTPVDGNRLFD